jgi:hypothetical protein
MATKTVQEKQSADNLTVLIHYNPANALQLLTKDAEETLAVLNSVKVTSASSLKASITIAEEGELMANRLETFRTSLIASVQKAAERFREIPGFEDFEISLTIRKWGLRTMLQDGIQRLRTSRSNYLAEEDRKLRLEQARKDEEQRRINAENARKAAEQAKKAGADKETVAQIKSEVLSTPAPMVESKTMQAAKEANVGVRYDWYADATDAAKFLVYATSNEVMLKTIALDTKVVKALEDAMRPMARAQKEAFSYPGMTYRKVAVDVQR